MTRDLFLASTAALAAPVRGLRVLLYGFSGRGFPGGDGVAEAVDRLPDLGIEAIYTHEADPERDERLAGSYDVAIVCNTRVAALMAAPERLWRAAPVRVLWFWDLRPGAVAAPLAGRVDRAFLSFSGQWRSPSGAVCDPEQWRAELGCPVGYCPQGSALQEPSEEPDAPRIVFVGDLANLTYHQGRRELCRAIGATVLNARDRPGRLAVEARMPALYRSARYVLSTSPLAPGYTSVRTYSILGCGGLMLLQRFPGAERLFRDGEHAVLFDAAGELLERLRALDSDPAERERIADAGRRLHAMRHTITHRILSICREATGASTEFSGWL